MKETDQSWLAALIDGEGTIGIGHQIHKEKKIKQSAFYPYIAISNLNREILEKAKSIIGSGYIGKFRGVYQFTTKKQTSIYRTLKEIKRFIIVKRKRVNLMLRFLEFNMVNFGAPQGTTHKDYFIRMRKLNLKRRQKLTLPKFFLNKKTKGLWVTKEKLETLYLKDQNSISEIARTLKVGRTSVWRALKRFGIKTRPQGEDFRIKAKQRTWSKQEVSFLIGNYKTLTDKEIAIKLGRTTSSVFGKRWNLGLRKKVRNKRNFTSN